MTSLGQPVELETTPFDRLGREEGCRRLSRSFYARVACDSVLKPLFPGKSLRCAAEEFSAFLIQFFDGDESQCQYRWWLSLRESHARFKIDEAERAAWILQMTATLRETVADEETVEALQDFFLKASHYILGREATPPADLEMAERWYRQVALDELAFKLVRGLDADAIHCAERFSDRKDVFVGILAKMMETGREAPIEYAESCVENRSGLGECRFNGRTLLHFAAGSGCLPVLRTLLRGGIDPDTLDRGKHTALYRAARGPDSEVGEQIVRELVWGGADADYACGISRSTALHEAARHGNLHVATALLDLGASADVRDARNRTPLDRAVNCRRAQVASLIGARS